MRKLIVEEWISLDGYAADQNGKLDFFAPHVVTSYESAERMKFREAIDTILLGATTYTQFAAIWPDRTTERSVLSEKMNAAKKIVFSRSLASAPWGKWDAADIESGDLLTKVNELKSVAGGNIVVWGSISLAQALMQANVVDEYHLHICPVITGGGRRFFAESLQPRSFTLIKSRQYGPGIVHLHYQKL